VSAANDKAPPVMVREIRRQVVAWGLAGRQVPGEESMGCRLLPDYHQNYVPGEGLGVLTRPAMVVTAVERPDDMYLEGEPPQNVYPVHPSRVRPKVTRRWGSIRRLMSSTESTL
jgi:hypothetical protein